MGQQPLKFRRATGRCRGGRAGLAPLELVAAIPILLMVTALMVNFGTLATWRVRGEIVSRDAIWRARWPRTGQREAPSWTWPAGAVSRIADGPQIGNLDPPELQLPVARGPLPNGFVVTGALDPERGYQEGSASITRRYPLLPRLGPYVSGDIEHPLLDQKWPCSEMGIPNVFRRTLPLYLLPTTDQSLPMALANATDAMFNMPNYPALYVLDQDADIQAILKTYVDFHPRIRHPYPAGQLVVPERCELDPQVVQQEEVDRLVDTLDQQGRAQLHRISYLPRTLTDFFLKMYGSRVSQLKADIAAWTAELKNPHIKPQRRQQLKALIAAAQAELNRIEPFLAPLEAYQARLGQIEAELRAQVETKGP